MPTTGEPEILAFSTWDRWSAADVAAFTEAVDGCYCSLLVMRDAIDAANRERERYARYQEEAWHMFRRHGPPPHPEWEMWMDEMMRMWRKLGSRGFPPMMPWMFGMGGPSMPASPSTQREYTLKHFLAHPEDVVQPADELQVHRIEMASPGGFSFSGLGEPIGQLRELIKDLWFRNRQERERGELQILRDKLELFATYNLSVQQIDVIATHMTHDVKELAELVENGKISLEGEEPRSLPNVRPSKRRTRRPRKKTE